jgi:hypothetical protein
MERGFLYALAFVALYAAVLPIKRRYPKSKDDISAGYRLMWALPTIVALTFAAWSLRNICPFAVIVIFAVVIFIGASQVRTFMRIVRSR